MQLTKANLSSSETPYVMLKISREEALSIARTILDQIDNNSSNTGRIEFHTDKGYFSLAVELDGVEQNLKKIIKEKDEIIRAMMNGNYGYRKSSVRVGKKISPKNKTGRGLETK